MDALTALRVATRDAHARIEALPVCQAVAAGRVTPGEYCRVLETLYSVHAGFESAWPTYPTFAAVWPATPTRAEPIARDLAVLGGTIPDYPDAAVSEWLDRVTALANDQPAAWAGVGYVLEGSRMGSRVLLAPLATSFGVSPGLGVGLDYHIDGSGDKGEGFRKVMAAIAALDTGADAQAAMVEAAVATFAVMHAAHDLTPVTDSALLATV